MQDLTRAQKARVAIQSFKTIANALALRGFFRPSGRMGQALAAGEMGPEGIRPTYMATKVILEKILG